MASSKLHQTLRDLVTANHILHYNKIVDAFGHVSVRHPEKKDVYIMCGYMPPAVVSSAKDLIEYYVDGSEPVDSNAGKGYSERFIHGELFKRFPDINCVVHSHAEAVYPYAIGDFPLTPVSHMAGFLGEHVPVWNIAEVYEDRDNHNFLVNNSRLGASLASEFGGSAASTSPDHTVVLMKYHGFTTHGPDIMTAIDRALYTRLNADVQTQTVLQQRALGGGDLTTLVDMNAKQPRVLADIRGMNENTQDKGWRLWVHEVEASPLYKNLV